MDTLANSYAVSPSNGDVRGDELKWRTGKGPQDRFADIPILADATEKTQSDNNAFDEADLGTELRCEQGNLSAHKHAGRSTPDDSQAATAAVALDKPTELSVQTKRDVGKGDSASARFSKTPCEEVVAVESASAGQKKQAAILGRDGKNGQYTQIMGGVVRKNGGFGAPPAEPSAQKESLPDTAHTLDEHARKVLSRKQSSAFEASPKSEGRPRGPGAESEPRVGSRRGSAPGCQNSSMGALLSRGRETQPGSHKGGASVPMEPGACLVSQPASAGSHTSVGTAIHEIVDGGARASVSQSVGEQILDSLKASMTQGDRQVLIRLQPPELGMVLVRFREQGELLDGMLQVDRTDTRREIEQALPEVVRSLQDAGIGIRRLDVTDGDSPGQDLGRGQSQQDGSSGYRDAGQDRDHLWASFTPWSPAAVDSSVDSQQVLDIQGATEMPRGRIDMLL
jgi:flagellar hook-length control protein FliK